MSLAFEVKGIEEVSRDWIGAFPSRWKVVPGFAVLRERQVKNVGLAEFRVLSLSYGRVIVKPEEKLRGLVPESFETYQIVEPGHIIIRPTDLQNDQVSLRVGQVHDRGIITSAYLCLEALGSLTPDFAHLVLLAYDLRKVFYGLGSGLRQNLSWSDFKRLPIPVPSADEQVQIVRFVRHLDQRVNQLIKAKRRLIELLNEQKQAIIHQAVTRGLDPNVPLKPSGVEWLGEVPSHWNLKRFKFVTQIVSGQVDPRISPFREMVLVAPNHIEKATGSLTGRETADEQGADSGKYLVKRGQVIYSKIRPNLQKATIAQEDCLCSADMYPIQPRPSELSPDYLLMLMLSKPFTQYVVDCSMRVAMPKVNRDALGNGWLWYPDLDSQTQILEFIASEGAPFDEAIARSRSEIDFIREYRTRLVADVVTGQLDVRHLDLPEVEESLIEPVELAEIDDYEEETEETEP